ncbi:MAG: ERCC4 domain-containing protein [Candidatus Micrarchaeia archaeon]
MESQLVIGIDDRELRSATARSLYERGCRFDSRRLAVGDYVVSGRCCIERKNDSDFEQSIMDGRLFAQAKELCTEYGAPIIGVVGSGFCRLDRKAIRGAQASLAVDFRIPVFFFPTEEEFAEFVFALAFREQATGNGPPRMQTAKKEIPLADLQQLAVESLPSIGPVHAKALLSRLGSVANVYNATVEELTQVEGVGKVRAERMRRVIDAEYGDFEGKEVGGKATMTTAAIATTAPTTTPESTTPSGVN